MSDITWVKELEGKQAILNADSYVPGTDGLVKGTHALVRVGDEMRSMTWEQWDALPVWDGAKHSQPVKAE
mgnify:CR=1 FL=1